MDDTDAPTAPGPDGPSLLPDAAAGGGAPEDAGAYQVLARKYRPETFAGLIGQEAMVRTLTNAIRLDRLAHAYILTGVRGIGKTTSARIIARALNCIGPDGTGGPTPEPCGQCANCIAIAQDRHVDVMEMDAASRTGVDDIREIIDGVRYRPTTARFKIYIIDEVHMLSKNAFNALLKTLEEPPEHVKFIFATTEIRKVPVTVLSRCQRFDLRRLSAAGLADHFRGVCAREGAEISDDALHLIARAADGSVRDGLSLLDQAIAMSDTATGGPIAEDLVRDMLGLADRSQGFDLLRASLAGEAPAALDLLAQMYQDGADPSAILGDLLEITHFLTRTKVVPASLEAPGVPEIERVRGKEMAKDLGMAALARAWQMLLKGLDEVGRAPSPIHAAEMVLVRPAHSADLPSPEEAIRKLVDGAAGASSAGTAPGSTSTETADPAPSAATEVAGNTSASTARPGAPTISAAPAVRASGGAAAQPALAETPSPETAIDPDPAPLPRTAPETTNEPTPMPTPPPEPAPSPDTETPATSDHDLADFDAVVRLAAARKEAILQSNLLTQVHLVAFEPGRIEFRPGSGAPDNLAGELGRFLLAETGERWMVSVSNETGQPTLADQKAQAVADEKAEVADHPLVKAVMETFPGAEIAAVRHPGDIRPAGEGPAAAPADTASPPDAPDTSRPPWEDDDIPPNLGDA